MSVLLPCLTIALSHVAGAVQYRPRVTAPMFASTWRDSPLRTCDHPLYVWSLSVPGTAIRPLYVSSMSQPIYVKVSMWLLSLIHASSCNMCVPFSLPSLTVEYFSTREAEARARRYYRTYVGSSCAATSLRKSIAYEGEIV